MRCPKCGKMLDDMAPQCPVCKTKFTKNDVPAESINNADGLSHSNPSTQYINQQGYQQIQPQYPTQQPQPQSYPQQNNTRFCGTCGTPMDANVPFCSRCGMSAVQSVRTNADMGTRMLNIPYVIYALLATNIIAAFASVFNILYVPPNEGYSFWNISSAIWEAYDSYNSMRSYVYNGLYEPQYSFTLCIISIVLMYVAIPLCAGFIIYAMVKAFSGSDSRSVLTPLCVASSLATVQVVMLIFLKTEMLSGIGYNSSSYSYYYNYYYDYYNRTPTFSFWFYMVAVLAIGSLIVEIVLINVDNTYNKRAM